jgi:formamidopyrimidine-DNA glycosylase
MPELPEVETVRRGLASLVVGSVIVDIQNRRRDLRTALPRDWSAVLGPVLAVRRRAKYLLIDTPRASLLSHLGMTGSWRIATEHRNHDHLDVALADGRHLVFHDPRRFGMAAVAPGGRHPACDALGPEPDDPGCDGAWLRRVAAGRRTPIKVLLMDQRIVVGIGNIYAQEALFRARVRPQRPAGRCTGPECERIMGAVRSVLAEAIAAGGSTISDFVHAGGGSGLFQHRFAVYGRGAAPCPGCAGPLRTAALAGRTTTWCARCQR